MMRLTAMFAAGLLSAGVATAQEAADKADLSYMLGYDVGSRLGEMDVELDYERFTAALKDAMSGQESALDEARQLEIRTAFNQQQQELMARKQEEQRKEMAAAAERNKAEGQRFLTENAKKEGVVTTESGLQYEVIEMGEGAEPAATDTVTVHYEGRLIDGTVFDSSIQRGEPATFALNQVIPGWTEGLQLMPAGSKYRFYIPSDLAYAGRSMGEVIGPNSTLIFDVELLDVESN